LGPGNFFESHFRPSAAESAVEVDGFTHEFGPVPNRHHAIAETADMNFHVAFKLA
jgi:hypothetical protein